jgi:hypothetical protein
MLVHIVCWKYRDEITEAARVDHRDKLRALVGVIPDIVTLDVGQDILHLDRSFDTGLVATFPDRPGLDAYTTHPEHQAVAALGKQIAQQVVSVDFMSEHPDKGGLLNGET